MSVASGKGRLLRALKDIRAKWDRVRDDWDDPVMREFEREYLEQLDTQVRTTVAAMDEMGELMAKARRDCG